MPSMPRTWPSIRRSRLRSWSFVAVYPRVSIPCEGISGSAPREEHGRRAGGRSGERGADRAAVLGQRELDAARLGLVAVGPLRPMVARQRRVEVVRPRRVQGHVVLLALDVRAGQVAVADP